MPVQLTGKTNELPCTSTSDENINKHINWQNEASFVSFQRKKKHICSGTRVTDKQILSVKPCSELISDYFDISAVFPAQLNDHNCKSYSIEKPQDVEGTYEKFVLVTVSNF